MLKLCDVTVSGRLINKQTNKQTQLHAHDTNNNTSLVSTRGVHGNWSSYGNGIPWELPQEWELDLNKEENGNGSKNG